MEKDNIILDITKIICKKQLLIHLVHIKIYEKLNYNTKNQLKLYQVMTKYISKLVFGNAYYDLKFGERIENQLKNLDLNNLINIKNKLNNII